MSELPQPPDRAPEVPSTRSGAQREWIAYRPGGEPQRTRAGCGISVLLGILAFVGAAGIALAAIAFRRGDDTVDRAVSDLKVGDCLLQPGGDSEYLFELTDCDDPHDDEVFATGRLNEDGGAPYPGLTVLRAQIELICAGDAFTDYVGVPAAQTTRHVLFITPDPQAWAEASGPYVCVIDGGGERLSGSARGTGS